MAILSRHLPVLLVLVLFPGAGHAAEYPVYDAWFGEVGGGAIDGGAPASEVEVAMKRITDLGPMATGPGSWVYEFSIPAEVHLAKAREADVAGKDERAIREYKAANAFFNAARWPALYTEERVAAYRQQLNTFLRLAEYQGLPLEVVSIPYEGKTIIGHLHKPKGGPAPVIVWSGGLDGWKDTAIDFKKALLAEGFAVFAMDLPGTGESEWRLEATSERIYSRAIDYLKTRDDVDGANIAPYFGSFSGAYAIKLALRDPDVKAAVNHSGGIHLFYIPEISELPPLTTTYGMRATATTFAMGTFGLSTTDTRSTLATFSLKHQGYLQETPNQAPLLTIHGTDDRLMPVQDVYLMSESGVEQETLIYEGSSHMAWDHVEDHRPKMILFLKHHLGLEETE